MSLRLVGAVAIAMVLAACSSEGPTAPKKIEQLPRPLSSVEQQIAEGSTGFGLSLLREVNEQSEPGTNVFISPLSASMALGMTATGAAGETLDSMRTVLGYQDVDLEEMDESYRSLIDLLRGLDPGVDFRIANSIWYRDDLPVEQSFVDATKKYFDAEVAALDFGSPGAVGTINDWVKRSTNDKIDKIVQEIPQEIVMYLINAIYFKGSWTAQFDKAQTRDEPFFADDGSQPSVPMMTVEGAFDAAATSEYSAVELPYGGGAYSMVVVVPQQGYSVDSLIARMDAPGWEALLASLHDASGIVQIPKFRLEWKGNLNQSLIDMGMGIAFDLGRADFTGISRGGGLAISTVDQKTYVNVDEEGTEAAAVTAVGITTTSAPSALLRADRPFLFAIRERFSGTLLFIGKMAVPPT
ncbi:MAG TPA: serpin family protein [Gemmatimonadaceae bacterium]|nr:serpin family protein [Gemmatimonadaceae bacterium]